MRDGGTQHQRDGNAHEFRDCKACPKPASIRVQAQRQGDGEPACNEGPNNGEEPRRPFTNVVTLPAEDHESAEADTVQDQRRSGDEAVLGAANGHRLL